MNRYISLIIVGLLPLIMGCKTTATQYKRIDGAMVETERLELKGLGDREATFSDKAKIKTDTTTFLPDIDIDLDKLKD